ncbi:MAG: PilZ domain-containing protein [Myxococcota bacterium]
MKGEVPIPVLANYFRVPYRGGIPIDYPGRDVLLQSRITNVSKNGVFVVTQNPLPKGSQFEVSFQLPGTSKPIQAECVVRWSTDTGADARPGVSGMGLEFTRIGRKDRKSLEKMVKEFISDIRSRANESPGAEPHPAAEADRTELDALPSHDEAALDELDVPPATVDADPFSDTIQEPRKEVFVDGMADLLADNGDARFTNEPPATSEFFPDRK